ncbi:MAG: hypothetical protein P8188_14270 [Gemmatimonadota bacterium]
MAISAKDVKELRDRTGAGMMDCKRALEETGGDMCGVGRVDPLHLRRLDHHLRFHLDGPEHGRRIREKIVEGKLKKWFKETALLEQPFVKDPDHTVGELITNVSAKTGEKIEVSRFARFAIGE